MSGRIPNKEAVGHLLDLIEKPPCESETAPIVNAILRVLSEDAVAIIDDPPYSKSLVNGYLFLSSGSALASFNRPKTFDILGDIPDPSMSIELPLGKTVRVKEDSYMAIKRFMEGHYTVLKESEAEESGGVIQVTRFVDKYENISLQGSIRKIGNIIFRKGHRLQAKDIVTLADQGIIKMKVTRPPKVAIFSTGKELILPGTTYKVGSKYDSNASCLSALISQSGGLPEFYGIMPNDLLLLIKKMAEVIAKVDMVVLSGATHALKAVSYTHLTLPTTPYV